mgnify:CR=1 FL=1
MSSWVGAYEHPDPVHTTASVHTQAIVHLPYAQKESLAEQEGVEVRILGDLDLAPPSVKGAAARLMQGTASLRNKRAVLNICFAYT